VLIISASSSMESEACRPHHLRSRLALISAPRGLKRADHPPLCQHRREPVWAFVGRREDGTMATVRERPQNTYILARTPLLAILHSRWRIMPRPRRGVALVPTRTDVALASCAVREQTVALQTYPAAGEDMRSLAHVFDARKAASNCRINLRLGNVCGLDQLSDC
jgi:hypothetical protein